MKAKTIYFTCITAIAIFFLIGIIIINYFKVHKVEEPNIKEPIIKIAIFPSGPSNTYFFFIDEKFVLKSYYGDRINDNICEKNFMSSILDEKEKQLSEHDVKLITKLADQLEQSDYIHRDFDPGLLGAWYVVMTYNGKTYQDVYWESEVEILVELLDKIIELSPLKVDIHSWS